MTVCPNCRRNLGQESSCPRCGLDLTASRHLLNAAGSHLQEGREYLRQQDFYRALVAFKAARRLHSSEAACGGIAVTLMALGHYRQALHAALKSGLITDLSRKQES